MKRFLLYIIIGIGSLTACSVEHSDNGDLDGFWKMTKMTTGERAWSEEELQASGVTWAFQGSILELRDVCSKYQDLLVKFRHEGDSLIVWDFRVLDRDAGDQLVTDATMLHPYGIYNDTEEHFRILQLTSDRMLLESGNTRLEFRKY